MDTNITPFYCEQPKYRIGDRVKQGLIVGLENYPPDSYLSQKYGTEWQYTLMPNKSEEDLEHLRESDIKPLSPQQVKTQIQAEIDSKQQQLKILKHELSVG